MVRTEGCEDNEEDADLAGRSTAKSKKPAVAPSIEGVSAIQLATPTVDL